MAGGARRETAFGLPCYARWEKWKSTSQGIFLWMLLSTAPRQEPSIWAFGSNHWWASCQKNTVHAQSYTEMCHEGEARDSWQPHSEEMSNRCMFTLPQGCWQWLLSGQDRKSATVTQGWLNSDSQNQWRPSTQNSDHTLQGITYRLPGFFAFFLFNLLATPHGM